jgi:hypothetical protein
VTLLAENAIGNNRLPFGLILAGILALGVFAFTASGGGGGAVVPVPATFIVTSLGNGASYNAYLSANSKIPFFIETNFTKIVNDDVLGSSSCTVVGCNIILLPGKYNQTQKIQVNVPLTITGTPSSIILPQNTFNTPAFNVSGNNFIFDGPRIDDFARRFTTNVACGLVNQGFCHVPIAIYGGTCTIKNAQLFNITTVGVFLTSISNNCSILFNTITGIVAQFTNATQPAMQGIEASGMSQKIEGNTVSYIRGGAGIRMGSGTTNNALHNYAQGNTIFHNEYGLASTRGIDIRMTGNTIYNSTSYGIYLETGLAAPSVFGPISITGNTISESSQGLCCGSPAGILPHIELRGTRCCWYSVSITGNSMLDRQSNMTTANDIEVRTTSYENLTITGNSLGRTRNTPTILLIVNPPDRSWIISDNPGFNPQPIRGPLTAGATPFTYTNNDGYREQLELITLGDMTAFTCRGIANIIQVDAISPILNTADTCVFTYITIAPTYDVLPT